MEMEMESRRRGDHQYVDHELTGDEASAETNAVDWRGRPSQPTNHGGMRAAAFVLGLQAMEIMAIAAVGNNLITYVINEMHFSLSASANIVTNFVGTIFLLALLGGYLSDSYLGCFWTLLIFGFVELSGFILLSVQAHVPQLKPPKCNMSDESSHCVKAKGFKALIFFVALYLVALGSGCVKPNMIAHGADQFDVASSTATQEVPTAKQKQKQNQQLSTYFNAAYFAFSVGELVALTVLVWVQTHSGMDVGFGVSAAVMAMGLICLVSGAFYYRNKRPRGSIFVPIAQVLVAAFLKRNQVLPSNPRMLHGSQNAAKNNLEMETKTTADDAADYVGGSNHHLFHTERFRFLDKACIKSSTQQGQEEDQGKRRESPWRLCTVRQVEQVKMLISVLPIFACTIVFNTILAQLQTFSVQQGSSMNTQLFPHSSFHIPPASLQAIPYILLIFVVPLYDAFLVPFARRFTGHESGISPLRRIGVGLFLVIFSMISAAIMENKRRYYSVHNGETLSILWIAPQFLIFGLSEMFTAVGLIEFFYKQSVNNGMQAFLTAITYCSYSFGFFLSSVLVSLVNKITASGGSGGWLGYNDLNKDRLDLFYWLLVVLSFLNFLNYLFWSGWVSRTMTSSSSSSLSALLTQPNPNMISSKNFGDDNNI